MIYAADLFFKKKHLFNEMQTLELKEIKKRGKFDEYYTVGLFGK